MKTTHTNQAATVRLAFATVEEMAGVIRRKEISARELLDFTFQRIDRYNPQLNAIIWQDREQAMARAKQADESLAKGRVSGALHGVPVTIKESFAYRGSPNAWGLPPLQAVNSPRTAVAVERLESAGAIVVGKTNVATMLGDWQSYNPIHGQTNNPWDLMRTPGGSTGGGAAAVAGGLGGLTIGSDLSGSIRIPAHFCGVYGHKPSLELVSMAGFQPGPWDGTPGYPMDIAVAGPLARSARDLALALEALGGANGDETGAWTWRLPAPRHTRIKDFRIGYVFDDSIAPVASDVAVLYEKSLGELRKAGARLEPGWPPGIDPREQMKTFGYLVAALVTVDLNAGEREQARKRSEKDREDVFAAAAVEPHARWLHETQRRLSCRAIWQKVLRESRRVSGPDLVYGGVPPRPQRAGRQSYGRDTRREATVPDDSLLDRLRFAGRRARDCRSSRTNRSRSPRWHADHRADVGRRHINRVCPFAVRSRRGIHAAPRIW